MPKSPELRVVMVGDTIRDQTLDIAAHSDVKEALLRGGLWGPTKDDRIENLSMILSISKDVGHAVAVRGGDFLAEAAIFDFSHPGAAFLSDYLEDPGRGPVVAERIGYSNRRVVARCFGYGGGTA